MHDPVLESVDRAGLKTAIKLSVISIIWTTTSSAATITLGILDDSLVLITFGLAGLLDAFGSVALVVHFRHSLIHEEFSQRHEEIAFKIVTAGLVTVASFTAIESVRRLINHTHSESSAIGIAIACTSAVVLAILATKKRNVARLINSQALTADALLSGTGCLLAIITVAGAALNSIGWWWADPIAAAIVGVVALSMGIGLHVRGKSN